MRALLEGACADQLAVLARDPDDKQAAEYLGYHRQTLCSCLGKLGDLSALEPVARDLGRTSGAGVFALGAARGLLRCAAGAAEPERMQSLRNEAVELLVEADRRGAKIDFDDALFAPVRNEPRLAAIRDR